VRPQDKEGYGWITEYLNNAGTGAHGVVYHRLKESDKVGHMFNAQTRWDPDLRTTSVDYIDGQTGRPARLPADPEVLAFMPVGPLAVPRQASSGQLVGGFSGMQQPGHGGVASSGPLSEAPDASPADLVDIRYQEERPEDDDPSGPHRDL
jgi:hypothetical protein